MKKARLGRWHICRKCSFLLLSAVEMKKARLGRWHLKNLSKSNIHSKVEMKKARLGRWHTSHLFLVSYFVKGRNEESPFRALTLISDKLYFFILFSVEMKKARLGRWHTTIEHLKNFGSNQ